MTDSVRFRLCSKTSLVHRWKARRKRSTASVLQSETSFSSEQTPFGPSSPRKPQKAWRWMKTRLGFQSEICYSRSPSGNQVPSAWLDPLLVWQALVNHTCATTPCTIRGRTFAERVQFADLFEVIQSKPFSRKHSVEIHQIIQSICFCEIEPFKKSKPLNQFRKSKFVI